jgi:hypothetical protein
LYLLMRSLLLLLLFWKKHFCVLTWPTKTQLASQLLVFLFQSFGIGRKVLIDFRRWSAHWRPPIFSG